jgi:hypothetical protein
MAAACLGGSLETTGQNNGRATETVAGALSAVTADASSGSPCSESCKLREDVVSYLIPITPTDRFPIWSGVTLFRASGSVSNYIPIPSSRSRVGNVKAMKADGVRSVHIDPATDRSRGLFRSCRLGR